MTTFLHSLDSFIPFSPPDAVPAEPPVTTRNQLLPFHSLTWENFERLCHRLVAQDGDVVHCARYGQQGEGQEGIDIYARRTNSRYHCLQAKRHQKFNAAKLVTAVDLFIAGKWAALTDRFTVAIQAGFSSTSAQNAIEEQAARLAERSIVFSVLDGESMSERLRAHPALVDDFFGRSWVVAFLGQEVANQLGVRLDGAEFARLRIQLAKIYQADFHFVDPGSFGSVTDDGVRPELSLLERFLTPDIVVRETMQYLESAYTSEAAGKPTSSDTIDGVDGALPPSPRGTNPTDTMATGRTRRLSFNEWCGDTQRLVLLGEAGCGKSTCLRVIALDLLHDQAHFPGLASRWGQHIPIYIPFALWSSQVERESSAIGLKEIVRRSLHQMLNGTPVLDLLDRAINDQRVLLLVDGLDEWGSVQAASTTLRALVTTVEAHGMPVIVSGRPRGLNSIGALPANWKRGTVAPLSVTQQSTIAGRWFGRYAISELNGNAASVRSLRTDHFMAELARDANLRTLAAVPLLLIGLVTLALRGQTLPRTKNDIYDQLVRILLEVHPGSRATASGATKSRFRYATDPIQRRAAIARLAFALREQTGGAGLELGAARNVMCEYLASPEEFALTKGEASAAAEEMLSVNAETQGLLIEKARSEVGFVHASFEEYLSAEHICGWSFSEIEAFVDAHAAESRWRNVITNVLGRVQRRGEFDQLIAAIETADCDEFSRYHRQYLLGDIAFGAAVRWTTTAKRLALATMARVETEEWLPARQEALASVLKGLADPTFKADIEQRLSYWLPARNSYARAALIEKLGEWEANKEIQDLLFRAMRDEDHGVQRAAAAAYSKTFAHSSDACQRLLSQLTSTRDFNAAAALLESLALGWPNVSEAASLFEEAWRSHSAELRLVGILGLAETGKLTDELRDAVLRGQNFWSDLSHPYRNLATTMLMKYWPGDETLTATALQRLSRHSHSLWEYDNAIAYVLESPVDHAGVRAWMLAEFEHSEFPFNMHGHRTWSQIGRFAAANSEIRIAANAFWCKPKNRLTKLHELSSYVAWVADTSVAAVLIEVLRQKTANFERYWALHALLTGWGRNHSLIKPIIDTLAEADDEHLLDLVPYIAEIMQDKVIARTRLLRMGLRPELRRDMLAMGFERCGCDSSDNEAVAAILAFPASQSHLFDPANVLLRTFGANARVRVLASELIQQADAPLAAIAGAYPNDSEFALMLCNAAVPLPLELRIQVVEVAGTGATGTVLERVLAGAMLETDHELRARMAIAHYSALSREAYATAKQLLLIQAVATGPDYESVRAFALAGLTTIGELGALVALKDRNKPVPLSVGSLFALTPSIARLVCDRFAEFEAELGEDLSERFSSLGNIRSIADILSVAPSTSPAARTAFLALAERGEIPRTPNALHALAAERPGSTLLLARCWDTLDGHEQNNYSVMISADIAIILRDHFSSNADVRQGLVQRYMNASNLVTAIALAIFAPDSEELPFPVEIGTLGRTFGDWAVTAQIAAYRADSVMFCMLLEAVVTRQLRSQFDAQHIINLAVGDRLLRDPELESLLCARIDKDTHPSVSGSFARYLAAAGRLSSASRVRILDLLDIMGTEQHLPIAGYDAIADQRRALRVTLLDALAAGLEHG